MKTRSRTNRREAGHSLFFAALFAALICASGRAAADPAQPSESKAAKPAQVLEVQQLRQAGWRASYPPYPAEALKKHEEGYVFLRVTTDGSGKVAKAVLADEPKSVPSTILREVPAGYIKMNWSGPPDVAVTVRMYFGVSPPR